MMHILVTYGSYLSINEYNSSVKATEPFTTLPSSIKLCKNAHQVDHSWDPISYQNGQPLWYNCAFYNKTTTFTLYNSSYKIDDWSISGVGYDYRNYLNHNQGHTFINWVNNKLIKTNEIIDTWCSPGWVTPTWIFNHKNNKPQSQLYRLLAALNKTTLTRPTNEEVINNQACVRSPFSILIYDNITQLQVSYQNNLYTVNCTRCKITNCLNTSFSQSHFYVLKHPTYILLPVNISEGWYTDPGLAALQAIKQALTRPKRFIAALILGITALIAIIGSVAASATALVQQVHTAQHVNHLSLNISKALFLQESIDHKLIDRINVLEEAVLYLGQEIQNIKVQLTTACHHNYKWICVTLLPYNHTEVTWEQIQYHITGLWNHSLTYDMQSLQQQITDISHAHLSTVSPADVAQSIVDSFHTMVNSKILSTSFYHIAAFAFIIIWFIIFFPVLSRRLFASVKTLQQEIIRFKLQNKKGGNGAGHAGEGRPGP